ncbi:hypothetical protein APE02nite_07490 [Alkalibacterium pelagium]|uniref:Uncharacterized protein n=1 Tax=Alkalibacterium pelagium TaxID=426702 RepID=A0A1H7IJL8_9LACT|nr:hypothetical protein [Alkalibacterium pelagium]GEN50084.1 hypothetical protein APE02nite_07490 [Alkalibacterium pelagium]SEK61740.1 hypothetical protein SAMN04488099_104131 [Alkalibacterium pelagium]
MGSQSFNKSIAEILDNQDLGKDVVIIKKDSYKRIKLPEFGKVVLKVHQNAVTHVSVENTMKIE